MVTARADVTFDTAAAAAVAAASDAPGRAADLAAGGAGDRGAGESLSATLAWTVLRTVPDPEIPVLSVVDLGIVRAIEVAPERGTVTVTVTPTYIGCPATEMIAQDIVRALTDAGAAQVVVRQQLAPAWSTDWIEPAARARMLSYGIVPPAARSSLARGVQPLRFVAPGSVRDLHEMDEVLRCPRCASADTERLSYFGSTACKALYRCRACREPFEYFKPL